MTDSAQIGPIIRKYGSNCWDLSNTTNPENIKADQLDVVQKLTDKYDYFDYFDYFD